MVAPPEVEDLGSGDEEEAEGLVRTPRLKRSAPAETSKATPHAPKKKHVKFTGEAGGAHAPDYVEVTYTPSAAAEAVRTFDLEPVPAPVYAQETELEAAKRKAVEALKAARARKLARGSDDDAAGLDKLRSKPKKFMLRALLSSPKKTSAGKYVTPL